MILNSSSRVLSMPSLSLSNEEKSNLYIPSDMEYDCASKIVKIDGEFYVWKYVDIINELIGAYLSRVVGLESAQYEIGIYNGVERVLSKCFFEDGFQYYYASDHDFAMSLHGTINLNFSTYFYCFRETLCNLDVTLREEMLKLIAVDLKMGQLDRSGDNIIFKQGKAMKSPLLAPAYDFSNAYSTIQKAFQYYKNPFLFLRMNDSSVESFVRKYPEIMQYIKMLRGLSMEQILSDIEQERKVEFEPSERDYRIELDQEYSRILKRI